MDLRPISNLLIRQRLAHCQRKCQSYLLMQKSKKPPSQGEKIIVLCTAGLEEIYLLEDPNILGVDDFGDSAIIIRVWIKTQPMKQWDVSREYRRRFKQAMRNAGTEIPFPRRDVWLHPSNEFQSILRGSGEGKGGQWSPFHLQNRCSTPRCPQQGRGRSSSNQRLIPIPSLNLAGLGSPNLAKTLSTERGILKISRQKKVLEKV
ncbi:MAG TPA: mechanosensitive ion channel family protein [Nodosilinea sp.]|nr:mechanosensitive ion channel family protein [Nodosilinea sp.]